jgi:hypothetical protein
VLRKIISRILQLLGLVGLPDDLKLWRNIIRDHVVPWGSGVVSFIASLWQGATWWQAGILAGLLVPIVYFALFLLSSAIRRWWSPHKEASVPADASEEKLTAQANRSLLYEALTERLVEGNTYLEDPDFYESNVIEKWEKRTSRLITAWLTTPLERRLVHRMHRLEQVMERVDSTQPLELQPDFDGREWVSKY